MIVLSDLKTRYMYVIPVPGTFLGSYGLFTTTPARASAIPQPCVLVRAEPAGQSPGQFRNRAVVIDSTPQTADARGNPTVSDGSQD